MRVSFGILSYNEKDDNHSVRKEAMKNKIFLGSLVLVVLTFIILQYNYTYQMKLASIVLETKMGQAIEKMEDTLQRYKNIADASNTGEKPQLTTAIGIKEAMKEALDKIKSTPLEENPGFTAIEKSIAKKYTPKVADILGNFIGEIDVLMERAKAEYYSFPAAERSKRKFGLGFKYIAMGEDLEKKCDDQFYAELNKMKADLEKNQLSHNLADIAILEYEQQKRTFKKALTNILLNKQ